MSQKHLLDRGHPEKDMPQFLYEPTKAILVSHIGCRNPFHNSHIICFAPCSNFLGGHSKLRAARMGDVNGRLSRING